MTHSIEHCEQRLADARQKLDEWDDRHCGPKDGLDHGMLNVPLGKRTGALITNSRIDQRKKLAGHVETWEYRLARARAAAERPTEKAREATKHEQADLKARYGGCSEVLWTLGGWLPVVRWNRKTVTVRMASSTDTIPHTQVGGAR